MKRLFCLLGLVLFLLPLAGCKGTIDANLDSQFTLAPGQSAYLNSEKMYVKFIGITQDSRCATGVECIRAGDVSFSIEISQNGVKSPATLTITGGQNSSMAFVSQTLHIDRQCNALSYGRENDQKGRLPFITECQ